MSEGHSGRRRVLTGPEWLIDLQDDLRTRARPTSMLQAAACRLVNVKSRFDWGSKMMPRFSRNCLKALPHSTRCGTGADIRSRPVVSISDLNTEKKLRILQTVLAGGISTASPHDSHQLKPRVGLHDESRRGGGTNGAGEDAVTT